MTNESNVSGGLATNGYTCMGCGVWVAPNMLHFCSVPNPTMGNTSFVPNPTVVALNEIRDVLKQILESLEKVRRRDTLWDE